jgi:uncharacterized protein (TIGR03545 family)
MIRWGRLAVLLTPIVLIWAGTRFFLDGAIKQAIESVGTKIVGAQVDVRDVSTRFWDLSATISGLAVTDPDEPMTNAVEIKSLRLKALLKPLFWNKVIVDRAEITGIRTGTPRKKSGAITVLKPAKEETPSAMAETAKKIGSAAVANIKDAYDPKKLVSPETLASYQKAQAEKERLTAMADQWKTRGESLDVKGISTRGQAFIEKVKNEKFSGVEGVAKAQALIKEGQSLKSDLAAAQKEVKSLGADLKTEMAQAKTTFKEIERLRREDIDSALRQLKSGFSTEGLTQGLLGPVWFEKFQNALGWVEKGRQLAGGPSDPKAPPPPSATRKGRDIAFPFRYRWPAFHLNRAALSGETPGGLTYEGTLSDLGTDPVLVGKPTVLDVNGRSGDRSLSFTAGLDLTKKVAETSVRSLYSGLPLAGITLGSVNDNAVSISQGKGQVKADVLVRGSDLAGAVDLNGTSVKLNLSRQKADRVSAALDNLLAGLSEGQIRVELAGTLKNPRFSLTSSVDNQLRNALKGMMDQETAKLRADVEKQINERVNQETEKLSALVEKNGASALAKLNLNDKQLADVQEKLNKALDDLTGSATKSIKLPDLKGLFKKK